MATVATFGFVYILTNRNNTVLYVGVTSNIFRRVMEHKSGHGSAFTKKYNLTQLVYYKSFDDITLAILEEKKLKTWKREWKIDLIEGINPAWKDLAEAWDKEDWVLEDLIQ